MGYGSQSHTIPAVARSTVRCPNEPKWSECTTQAEFYHHARLLGLPVLLEVRTPVGIVDIAVLRTDRSGIVTIIECKRNGRAVYGDSRQIKRYKRLGVPIYGLNDFTRAERLAKTIAERHSEDLGVSWTEIGCVLPIPRTGNLNRMAEMADRYHATTG